MAEQLKEKPIGGPTANRLVSRKFKPAAILLSRSQPENSGLARCKPAGKIRLSCRKNPA